MIYPELIHTFIANCDLSHNGKLEKMNQTLEFCIPIAFKNYEKKEEPLNVYFFNLLCDLISDLSTTVGTRMVIRNI